MESNQVVQPEVGLIAGILSKIKKPMYSVFVAVFMFMPLIAYYLGGTLLNLSDALVTWMTPFLIFVIVPLLDVLIGEDPLNLDMEEESKESQSLYYRIITLLVLPFYAILLYMGMVVYNQNDFNMFETIGWIISVGSIGGGVGIVHAHELVHKSTKYEQIAGGLILSLVSYAGFKIEHVYGHHVTVSTPEDSSSSRYNQSLYSFLPKAFLMNTINAWKLQYKRCERKNEKFWSLKNELINYYLVTLAVLFMFVAWQGWFGAAYFLGSSLMAFGLLEVVNYVEHYGLHREKDEKGKYERVRPEHSWNSNHIVTNLLLINLQRHSDHHAKANRRYQVLRNFEESPQLPSGYASMIVLALFPPLWKKVMNPRVEAYYKDRPHLLLSAE